MHGYSARVGSVSIEPFYENYGPDAVLSGAVPRYVTLHEPDWRFDPDELRAVVSSRTRAMESVTEVVRHPLCECFGFGRVSRSV